LKDDLSIVGTLMGWIVALSKQPNQASHPSVFKAAIARLSP